AAAAETARAEAARLARKFETINSSIGAELQDILGQIEILNAELTDAATEVRRLQQTQFTRQTEIGRLETQRTVDEQKRAESIGNRDSAAARLRHLSSGYLLADAGLDFEVPDGVRPTLDAARKMAATLELTPHSTANIRDAEHRLSEAMHEAQDRLVNRADLALESDEDIQLFVATMNGVRVGATAVRDAIKAERDRSRADITAAERTIFDKTLTGDTRRHLAARIRQATEMVDAMNDRLERVRTASNVAVRLVWQVDPQLPTGTREARDLLLNDPIRLTDSDRDALHRFFRERIDEARAADTAQSWEQQLFEVLDYTAWHQFVVKLDRADGNGWQTLTKKLHGALSGGEKAIALHLPLFAAVASHYESVPNAPRLILLDEVFVGVDSANRGQVFELLASLDLDLVLTSDHEWCTYAELDGIAIHQLITGSDGDPAVTTARFTWDGHELVPDDPQ
ncbi:MAG: TIGR02680 family protein, partial [Mycobacterium sp.]|nr:TIGR02680 family protein [Mycobacterium sp.]